jgi:hypothetical protein
MDEPVKIESDEQCVELGHPDQGDDVCACGMVIFYEVVERRRDWA